jgi:hypothetical protein
VNIGALDHLHLVEISPTAELRRAIALCAYPEKITLHTRPYWELELNVDLAFIDGDHRWPAVADVFHAVSRSIPIIAMHDSASWPAIKSTWGAHMAASNLRRMAGRFMVEDRAERPGMATQRGFLVSVAEGVDSPESITALFDQSLTIPSPTIS